MPRRIDEEALFLETCRLFVEEGFWGMTTRELALRAGVNEVTLFRRFGSKAGLLCAAVNHVFARVPFARPELTGELRRDLEAVVGAYLETRRAFGPLLQVLLSEAKRFPELDPAFGEVRRNMSRFFDLLEHYRSQGSLRAHSSLELASALLGPLVMGDLASTLAEGDSPPFPDPKLFVERFLHGHAGGGG